MTPTQAQIDASDQILSIRSAGEILVTIKADKTMEFGPNYTPDAAAKVLWDAVLAYYPAALTATTFAVEEYVRGLKNGRIETIERCAQVAENYRVTNANTKLGIASAIRALATDRRG